MNNTANKEARPTRMYFIALVLPKPLDEKVLGCKNWMKEKFGCKVGLKSPAHITLVPPFWMEEEREVFLKKDMEYVVQSIPPFQLSTTDFSAFRPRTIFVAVQESAELNTLKKKADEFFRFAGYKMKRENRPFHPHITIATRDLHKKDFAEAWLRFQQKEFRETFEANGLSLLRHNGQNWDVVFTAPFNASTPTEPAVQP